MQVELWRCRARPCWIYLESGSSKYKHEDVYIKSHCNQTIIFPDHGITTGYTRSARSMRFAVDSNRQFTICVHGFQRNSCAMARWSWSWGCMIEILKIPYYCYMFVLLLTERLSNVHCTCKSLCWHGNLANNRCICMYWYVFYERVFCCVPPPESRMIYTLDGELFTMWTENCSKLQINV